jgi:hypothetical protein
MPAWLMLPPLLLVGLLTWSCIRPIEIPWGTGGFGFGRYFGKGPYSGLTTWNGGGILIYPIPPLPTGGSYLVAWGSAFTDLRQQAMPSVVPPASAASTSDASVMPALALQTERQANGTRIRVGKPAVVEFVLPSGWQVARQPAPQSLVDIGAADFDIRAEHQRTKTRLTIFGAVLADEMLAKAILDPVGAELKNVTSSGDQRGGVKYYWVNRPSRKNTRRYRSIKLRKGRVVLEASAILPTQTPPEKLAAVEGALKELQETVRIQAP